MSKIRRGGHSAEGEPLSAGRVEYLEAARARVRTRRIRRTVVIVAVLTILVLFATGAVGSSIARAKDLVDTAVIALAPAAGWPQQTGITDPDAVAQMSGSFVEMGGDSCVVYSLGGTRLNSIQSGYARPAIAAGKTRFVLYNRSGNELRVESRTQNLYTKTMDSTISLCAVADAGQVAVVTDSTDSVAKLTVYNSSMQQQLVWNLTSEQGTPLRMAFAPDSRRLAEAVQNELETQLSTLPRQDIARQSIQANGRIIVTDSLEKAVDAANLIAPEHLELCVEDPFALLPRVKNAGSIFLGRCTPEALGDYFAGPNHTLPTSGTARFSSPLSVDDFVKKSSFLYYTQEALAPVAERIADFARREGLEAHARSALIRTNQGGNPQ